MKLPENYENWIEFAKKCNEFSIEHPNTKIVNHLNKDIATEFRIDTVKAKAFDEVMGLANEAKNEVKKLENSTGTDMAILTRFLILVAK